MHQSAEEWTQDSEMKPEAHSRPQKTTQVHLPQVLELRPAVVGTVRHRHQQKHTLLTARAVLSVNWLLVIPSTAGRGWGVMERGGPLAT